MTATEARSRPILMNGDMARSILGGRKTVTRRPVKAPKWWKGMTHYATGIVDDRGLTMTNMCLTEKTGEHWEYCPFGVPGSRLWVRETFAPRLDVDPVAEPEKARHYALYRADGTSLDEPHWHPYPSRWTPSILMPRWASRITLEITSVRVERLQGISEADAMHEGDPRQGPIASENTHRDWFRSAWDGIYGRGEFAWERNPWVWRVAFRKLGEQ